MPETGSPPQPALLGAPAPPRGKSARAGPLRTREQPLRGRGRNAGESRSPHWQPPDPAAFGSMSGSVAVSGPADVETPPVEVAGLRRLPPRCRRGGALSAAAPAGTPTRGTIAGRTARGGPLEGDLLSNELERLQKRWPAQIARRDLQTIDTIVEQQRMRGRSSAPLTAGGSTPTTIAHDCPSRTTD